MRSSVRTVPAASVSDGPSVSASDAMSSIAAVPVSNDPDTAVSVPANASTASTVDTSTSSARSMVSSTASSVCTVTSRLSSEASATWPTKIQPTTAPTTATITPTAPRAIISRPARRWSCGERQRSRRSISSVAVLVEGATLGGEAFEQWRQVPVGPAERVAVVIDPVHDLGQADRVGPVHRSATVDGPAVAVHPHHVDVAATDGDALVEDLRALVDHRVQQAFEHLLVGDLTLLDALADGEVLDQLDHVGIRCGGAGVGIVGVVAATVLLPAATVLAQHLTNGGAGRLLLVPADVEASQVAHGERAHGEAELVEHVVDLGGRGAFEDHPLGLGAAHEEHPVADEAAAHTDHHRDLADLLADRHRGGHHRVGRLVAAHVLEQLHHVGRREEVHADHALGP